MGSSNETSFFGNVNPVGDHLVPGGSSGGSSSALAADLTLLQQLEQIQVDQ